MNHCSHATKRLYRVLFSGGQHIREICPTCGANVRGQGINVPFREAPVPDSLPIWKDLRKQPQPSLFEGMQ